MSEQSILNSMENWGYCLLPRPYPDSPGCSGLLVAIREIPTKHHFDPESMELRLYNADNPAHRVILKLQPPFSGSRRVSPGRVVLHDRIDKRAHFFTFGGSLEVTTTSGETVYSLHSPAPILEITGNLKHVPDQLAFEVEAMLARFQAEWGSNDESLGRRLAQIDPLQFYQASLQAILRVYEQNRAFQESSPEFYLMLLNEKEWLAQTGQWSATLPRLKDLLTHN